MNTLPILFQPDLVRAILDGIKTETRRHVIRWEPGDLLWVRETWRVTARLDDEAPSAITPRSCTVMFAAGGSIANTDAGWRGDRTWPPPRGTDPVPDWANGKWRPSIFLPRWASRLTLRVTAVRREPLSAITDEGAVAEGVADREAFIRLWDRINGDWNRDPSVFVTTFDPLFFNIDDERLPR